ncbi:MAG: hypothetical protein AAB885_02560 [Patescibacteria group bacterium]
MLTIKLKLVDLGMPLAENPLTVIEYVSAGVSGLVEIVRVLLQFGLHEVVLRLALAPDGKPKMESDTSSVGPETRLTRALLELDDP